MSSRHLKWRDNVIVNTVPPLHRALFLEINPAGPKYALSRLGRMQADVRLPLVTVSELVKAEIDSAMQHAGLIN